MMVLDCVASGAIWVDMQALGIDVLVTAPQKGWSGSPCCGMVALSSLARERIEGTTSTSFACDLKKWLEIMEIYEQGKHAYHATPPTDALIVLRDIMKEMEAFGFEKARKTQLELGTAVRKLMAEKGFPSVAAPGFEAPGVVVSYTTDPAIQSGKKFLDLGMQVAPGVPIKCDEPEEFRTFRVGLFGLDKLGNVDRTVKTFAGVLSQVQL
jgi:aspartate aminotransferase-like enzyme